jgi:hypothetical protein
MHDVDFCSDVPSSTPRYFFMVCRKCVRPNSGKATSLFPSHIFGICTAATTYQYRYVEIGRTCKTREAQEKKPKLWREIFQACDDFKNQETDGSTLRHILGNMSEWEAGRSGSRSCPMAGFRISGVQTSGSVTSFFIKQTSSNILHKNLSRI